MAPRVTDRDSRVIAAELPRTGFGRELSEPGSRIACLNEIAIPGELISRKTRYEFQEFLVGWTLRTIEGAFDAADIERRFDHQPRVSGERRFLVAQYYASLDFTRPRDVAKLLKAYEYILNDAFDAKDPFTGKSVEPSSAAKNLVKWLRKDGYDYVDGKVAPISNIARVTDVRAAAQELDAPHMAEHISRLEAAIDADPALAIGSAKELVETCCKTILTERGVNEEIDKLDLGPLVKRTARSWAWFPSPLRTPPKAQSRSSAS